MSAHFSPGEWDATRKGILCMIAASALITMNDALVKLVTEALPVGQVLFIRAAFLSVLISVFVVRRLGVGALRVRDRRSHALRAISLISSTFLFTFSLRYLSLPVAATVASAGPLFVTALAPVLLGESVRWRRWAAVVVGFSGVVLITRPTGGGLHWLVLLPLGSAFASALADIVTRHMTATESSISILFYTTLGLLVASLMTAPFGWSEPGAREFALLALAALFEGAGLYLMIESFRHGEATIVAPFRYLMLLWAVLLGLVIWGDFPTWNVFAGAAAIMGSALYIFHRESVRTGRAG